MLRALCGPFFVAAGALHFARPQMYEAIVPPSLPHARGIVLASGVAEVAGGVGLMTRWRGAAGWWLIATLVAIFPANVNMALHPERFHVPGGRVALYARLPFQGIFIAWVRAAMRAPS